MDYFNLSAVYARSIPDPIIKHMKKHILICRCNSIPPGIPAEVNARPANTNRRIYKDVRDTLLNLSGEKNAFHHKNSGMTILADDITKKSGSPDGELYEIKISDPSKHGIVNGNHTYTIINECNKNNSSEVSNYQYVTVEVRTNVPDHLTSEIAQGLNTSMQVQKKSLEDSKDSFEWIKDSIKDEEWSEQVAYSENSDGDMDIREILSILMMLNPRLFPNGDRMHPTIAYSSKSKVLDTFIEKQKDFEAMKPILKDCLYLYDSITCGDDKYSHGFRRIWNDAGGKAGAWNATEKKSRKPHKFHIINKEDLHKLDKAFAYPIFSAFRWFVRDNGNSFEWDTSFEDVLNIWKDKGDILLASTKEHSDALGGKLTPLGRSNALYAMLHTMLRP